MRPIHTFLLAGICSAAGIAAPPSVRLAATLPSPQPVGTVIGVMAVPKDEGDPEKLEAGTRTAYLGRLFDGGGHAATR